MRRSDKFFYLFVAVGALLLAAFGFCLADWAYAAATLLVVLFWAWMLHRKTRAQKRSARESSRER